MMLHVQCSSRQELVVLGVILNVRLLPMKYYSRLRMHNSQADSGRVGGRGTGVHQGWQLAATTIKIKSLSLIIMIDLYCYIWLLQLISHFVIIIEKLIMPPKKPAAHPSISELPLQSYKLDSSLILSKIDELNSLKSELQQTISHYKQESVIIQEFNSLKSQNQKLKEIANQSQWKHKEVGNQLQKTRKENMQLQELVKDLKAMYENQRDNKVKVEKYYQLRLSQFVNDKNKLVDLYQDKIESISQIAYQSQMGSQQQNVSIRQSIASIASRNSIQPSNMLNSKIPQPRRASSNTQHVIRQIPLNTISKLRSVSKVHTNPIVELEDECVSMVGQGQDHFLEMIRCVYKKLKNSNTPVQEFKMMSKIRTLAYQMVVTKQDFIMFSLHQQWVTGSKAEKSAGLAFNFIQRQASKKLQNPTGLYITKFIQEQLQELEIAEMMSESEIVDFSQSQLQSSLSNIKQNLNKPHFKTENQLRPVVTCKLYKPKSQIQKEEVSVEDCNISSIRPSQESCLLQY